MKKPVYKLVAVALISVVISACSSSAKEGPLLGAAMPGMQMTENGQMLTVSDVQFDSNRAALREESDHTVFQAAKFMYKHKDAKAVIKGHTDSRGSEQHNIDLAARRSHSVRNALIAEGIDSSRIETVAVGESEPLATNRTDEGRQANRRVEIFFPR